MSNRNGGATTIRGTVFLSILVVSGMCYAQEKGEWRFVESKDPMTDKITNMVAIGANGIGTADASRFVLTIARDVAKGRLIAISLPTKLPRGNVTVQWRVDDLPMVEESWTSLSGFVGTLNNDVLFKKMLAGTTLKVRFASDGETSSVLEYNIKGLSYYLPKLGIATEK
jgi:hypothetical protein